MWVTGREDGCFRCHQKASNSETLKKGLPKPSRENTGGCGRSREPSLGKAEKEKVWVDHISEKGFPWSLGRKKRPDDHVKYSKLV